MKKIIIPCLVITSVVVGFFFFNKSKNTPTQVLPGGQNSMSAEPDEIKSAHKNQATRINSWLLLVLEDPALKLTGYQKLNSFEVEAVIKKYRSIPVLSEKIGLVYLLAFSENQDAVDFLIHTIQTEFVGKKISSYEQAKFAILFVALGILGEVSLPARHFLQDHASPAAWGAKIPFITESGVERDLTRRLSTVTLRSIGFSGNAESLEYIYNFAQKNNDDLVMRSAAGESLYHYVLKKTKSKEDFVALVIDPTTRGKSISGWLESQPDLQKFMTSGDMDALSRFKAKGL